MESSLQKTDFNYPIFFNTTESDFEKNRQKAKDFRLQLKNKAEKDTKQVSLAPQNIISSSNHNEPQKAQATKPPTEPQDSKESLIVNDTQIRPLSAISESTSSNSASTLSSPAQNSSQKLSWSAMAVKGLRTGKEGSKKPRVPENGSEQNPKEDENASSSAASQNTPSPAPSQQQSQNEQQKEQPQTQPQSPSQPQKPTPVHSAPPVITSSIEPLSVVLIRILFQSNFVPKAVPAIRPRGLVNTGNICFMSSILQVLLYCPPFFNTLKIIEKRAQSTLIRSASSTPLLDTTLDFIDEFNRNKTATQAVNSIANGAANGNGYKHSSNDFGIALNPEQFYSAISKHPRFQHLRWGQQEDAEEFLGYFLDGLHEEFSSVLKNTKPDDRDNLLKTIKSETVKNQILNTLSSFNLVNGSSISTTTTESDTSALESSEWQEVGSSSKKNKTVNKRVVEVKSTPISNLFGGQFRSELEVPKSKEPRSVILDPFQHVQLDISDDRVHSLETAFSVLAEPEEILYKSSQGKEIVAKKQTFIDKLPKVLVIHLKRFSYISNRSSSLSSSFSFNNSDHENGEAFDNSHLSEALNGIASPSFLNGRVEKLKKRISYSHKLEIPSQSLSKTLKLNNNVSKEYKLTGVVYHHGSSTDVGHYTVDVLRPDKNTWIRIDDTKVDPISSEQVISGDKGDAKSAYILMYQRV